MRVLRVGIFTLVVALSGVAVIYMTHSTSVLARQPQVLAAAVETVDKAEMSILDKINKVRVESGSKELTYSTAMKKLTTDRVSDMATRQYYSHKNPDGYTFAQTIHDYDSASDSSCENLQLQIGDSWQEAVDAWINSPAHHRCLTDPNLTRGAGSMIAYDEVNYDKSSGDEQMFVFAFVATN